MARSKKQLRGIPSVDKLLAALGGTGLPRPLVVDRVRGELNALRKSGDIPEFDAVVARIRATLQALERSRIRPVINATGVIVHTNLGRSPLGEDAVRLLSDCARNYNDLEFDLASGKRGKRGEYLELLLALLCKSQAATVVNNCAAALILMLRHFTAGEKKEVIISRGELIQIGGGFRIPEILESSGAILREVGSTNRTSLADYRKAVGRHTAMILKVHRSNFWMDGFVESADPAELAAMAKSKRVPVIEDLGSGALVPTDQWAGIVHEPTPAESLKAGYDLVCFSGDKLLGGPQAGIIAGKTARIRALKKEPMFRALRCDKLVLAALQASAEVYLEGDLKEGAARLRDIPALRMMNLTAGQLRERAEVICARCGMGSARLKVVEVESKIGGGTLPQAAIPSLAVSVSGASRSAAALAAALRELDPPVIGYTAGSRLLFDLRTVFPAQDDQLIEALVHVLAG